MDAHAVARHQAKVKGYGQAAAKKPKYGNTKIELDGITFDSRREADRYAELKILRDAREITNLRLQPCYPIVVNGQKICDYYADFSYDRKDGVTVTEDAKGMQTEIYRLKKKLVRAVHGVIIHET